MTDETSTNRHEQAIADRMGNARRRQLIAGETIALCRRVTTDAGSRPDAGTALAIHEAHVRHARELGYDALADLAQARVDREHGRLEP
jgi:predicted ATPase